MPEGMVSSKDRMGSNETIMDVAEHYLNELAERSMVFVQKEEEYSFTRFKSCRLHDLMRDLCISKAKEEKFLASIDYGKIYDVDEGCETSTICRLSISFPVDNDAKRFVQPANAMRKSLRSLTLDLHKGKQRSITLKFNFSEFVMLRVLSLDGVGLGTEDDEGSRGLCGVVCSKFDPLSIGKLLHLRYLSLRFTLFHIMSSSISNLKQLQTLDLRGCDHFWWISDEWNFPQLHHLYLPRDIQRGPLTEKLGFDGLPQLEILEGFNNTVCNVNHLSILTKLRKLEATVQYNLEDLEELINHMRKLTHLRFFGLTIYYCDLSSEKAMAIMNDILSYSNLVTLNINGTFSKFPEYDIDFCQNLRSLTLWGCEIEEDPMSTLERLLNLRELSLYVNSFIGKEMSYHASGFPQLRILTLWKLHNLEKWEIEDGAMPKLSELTINSCSKLEMIPAGLRSNTLLRNLNIYKMPEEFHKRIGVNQGQEGADFAKVRHVQTIRIVH